MTDTAQSPPTSHLDLYNKIYTEALRIVAAPGTKDDDKLNQKITIILDTITKLIFGSDASMKAKLVLHGAGTLELIIELVQMPSVCKSDDKTLKGIQMSALKAVKTCVLRNPAGRSRCRSAQVYKFLGKVLLDDDDDDDDDDTTNSKLSTNALLTEEAFTTLAATCLGDDLNALEASTIFKPLIKKAKENFSNVTSMQQKILYLETLFAAVEKEQERLLQKVKKDGHGMDSFFKNVVECESNIRTGYSHLQDAKYNMSFKHYNHAMNLILAYSEYTSLLDPLMLEIRTRRAHAAFEAAKYEECVQDACILLQGKDVRSEETRANLLKVKGKALIKMGCHDEGRETLAKWKILCPQGDDDEEIETLHQNVNIS
eukprot:CAMPEP_0176495152 /NCGR_PEP_ID=MMETSP0200_2-20121128/10496_1 /TAXON_ID=947934 /ORGANISM="Chaetoceros sp., Strain GSL56" /LENGTH=371 /DNA_ID=CAMNT_0017892995 /DNA_START=42 /DNA_END=1160 /DNA_ORIENTATION=-